MAQTPKGAKENKNIRLKLLGLELMQIEFALSEVKVNSILRV